MISAICQFTFCRNAIYPFYPAYHVAAHWASSGGALSVVISIPKRSTYFFI